MPTDHHHATTDHALSESRQAVEDRHALNVRKSAQSLLDSLMRETDSLIKMGEPYMQAARESFALSMDISAALSADDIPALSAILDRPA